MPKCDECESSGRVCFYCKHNPKRLELQDNFMLREKVKVEAQLPGELHHDEVGWPGDGKICKTVNDIIRWGKMIEGDKNQHT